MMAALSFFGHYWQMLLIAALALAVLAFVVVVLKNWKAALGIAAIAAVILFGQFMYGVGYKAKVDEEVAERVKILQGRLDTLQRLADADKQRADQDAAEIEHLRSLAAATPVNPNIALPAASVKRVQAVRK